MRRRAVPPAVCAPWPSGQRGSTKHRRDCASLALAILRKYARSDLHWDTATTLALRLWQPLRWSLAWETGMMSLILMSLGALSRGLALGSNGTRELLLSLALFELCL
ncbi:hypothetical protein EMIHUDRAFT_238058 [Emiliania huxleyi CCMP1516]|uniref:ABC transmembrane type-1 domain-containing protein n=2 Tax=Emiliania huxleyi TaxID=2903 RepID=A0A0D3JN90_EMIH1|nr:hypothetical protein EMIHUDRAFT_238058 [Emiliania huxleyi CCMP1516]EOD24975.1 hypothetical protein EMIHUDRAFT_238058 [Emiliania huxleyi CCMP1516]|eukprot:XP_005777404.1 hypothetical protein EMIHUDRAFT_238058 [Emiliania huxleyi CCMP1516]